MFNFTEAGPILQQSIFNIHITLLILNASSSFWYTVTQYAHAQTQCSEQLP